MKFMEIVEKLQEENRGYVIIVRCGIFFNSIGKDAVFMQEKFGLGTICAKPGVCKNGIAVASIQKMLPILKQSGYSYKIYDYEKPTRQIEEIYRIDGKLMQEEYIKWLYEKLKNGTYKHGGYSVFYITEPKLRRIEKSKYIDRIVHRWYVNSFMETYFVRQFINTSYACLKGKGMHKASIDLQKAMNHCSRIWGNYYILKMDVTKYFENINKNILYNILKRKIKDEKVKWLTKEIIYSNEGEKGLPIGNYTSQLYANIYLNELDQYIKHKLKCKYYFRYMDDAIILIKTKEEAKGILEEIKIFLKEKLELELNSKTQIFKNKQGVNFCGYKINENRLKIRDKGKRKLKKKIKELKYKISTGEITSKEAKKYLVGHIGYMKIANTYNLEKKLF